MTDLGRGWGGARVWERVGDGDVQGLFFSGCPGVIRGRPYLVEALGGVQICSGLFGFVQVCSGCAGVERGNGGG